MRWLAPDPELTGWHLSVGRLSWLAASLALVIAPHASRMPSWIPLLFALLAGWRLWRAHRGDDRPPARWLVAAIALAVLPGVYLSYGTLTGRAAGVALLTLLAGVKLVETRGLRDAYVVSYLGFFLVITNFLYEQDIATGLYMLAVVVVMTAALLALGGSPGRSPAMAVTTHLRRGAVMVAQAVPLMLALFVLFPRIPGPLWGLPRDAHAGVTGIGDDMSPGNISALSQSDAVAFRVEFQGTPPPPAERYWRGPVLDVFDGRRWSRGERPASRRPVPFERRGPPLDYEVTMEPSGARWLFALDLPAVPPPGGVMTRDLEILAGRHLRERLRFPMRSYPDYGLGADHPGTPAWVVSLPVGAHPRARALARSWREEAGAPGAVVQRALAWFAAGGFVYTLTPPLLPGDPVDDFLFGTRAGFCEHYAGAFVVLMRAAGIPARVVTGYQGGEVNPLGGYMIVRQRDAHAWTEVWIAGAGWVRVDPTAAVSPLRVQEGLDAAIPPTVGAAGLTITPAPAVTDAFRRLRQAVDAVQTRWNAWVLGYGPERQRRVLSEMGLDASSYGTLVLALTVTVALLLAALAAWLFARRGRRDPVLGAWDAFCARLARAGLPREPHEGPRAFAARVAARRPDLAAAVSAVADAYVALRYAQTERDPEILRRQVADFRL